MAKRNDHEGSIRKLKDGSGFKGAVRLGVDIDGKPIRKFVQRKRKDEVQAEIKKLVRKFELNQQLNGRNLTVARFMAEWLEDWVKPNRSYGTHCEYEQATRTYIIPLLGKAVLDDLTGQDVQKFVNKLGKLTDAERRRLSVRNCRKPIERLSPATIRKIHATLKSALSRAVKWGRLPMNPAKNAESPKQQKYVGTPLTPTQATALLEVVAGDRYEAIFTCAALGLRKGEILGLRWADFVWSDNYYSAGVLNVTSTLKKKKGKGLQVCDVKTPRSRRTIKLPKFVIQSILRRQLIQDQERLDAGEAWKETGLVFTNHRHGGPLVPEKVNTMLDEALKKIGAAHVRVHDLRHTAATLLLAKGVQPKTVSEILGHADSGFTVEVYGHVIQQMRDEAADTLERMYGGKGEVVAQVVAPTKPERIQ